MKKWLKKILGITKLEEDLSSSKKVIEILRNNEKFALQEIENLKSLVNVGVDVHLHNPRENWAVICIQGKPDYVKFVHLGERDIKEIQRFLRNFDSKNVTIDTPMYLDKRRFLRL
ncbi:MAG: hypothetical protein PQJ49_01705 [Sphaerochaetaceae bacterium]|nr:hypothetical protein [Sphaerochaetaceae bacterium]